jgi:hypothetical protein
MSMNERSCAVTTLDSGSPFTSRTVTRHLLRGVVGLALLVFALVSWSERPVLAIAEALVAVVALRGCPMCWTIGLVETVMLRLRAGR